MVGRVAKQSSNPATGLSRILSETAWRDLSPLGPGQMRPAQKMLCRRLFARPGGWLARPR